MAPSWANRLRTLLDATGWTQKQAALAFGRSWSSLARVLKGNKTVKLVELVVRLKELEEAHAGEIEALRAGVISYRRHRGRDGKLKRRVRYDFRARVGAQGERVSRPADLAALGAVGGSNEGEGI